MSDIISEGQGNGDDNFNGCNGRQGPPCHDIGMKYGIVIGIFPGP